MRRKARLLMTLMMLVSSLQAVAVQGNYDDFKALYLQDVSPKTIMWCETLAWVALCFLMWYIHGALSSEDEARGDMDDLHETVLQQTEIIRDLSERLDYLTRQSQCATEAIINGTGSSGGMRL